MKVLVVDDNRDITTIIQMMIEKQNHRVITATDGENGYSAYLQFKPDLVLIDIQMPGKNGFELMAKIRSHNPSIMAIYMTGDPDRFLLRLKEEQNRHQVDFIRKPFSIAELLMMLPELIPAHKDCSTSHCRSSRNRI
ncbi:MAG: response regulator [Proteobacteria bacterium]|nr:response regulator [Pseudomonadota bacterium]